MTASSSKTAAERGSRQSLAIAWLILPLALFPAAALLTYDWHAVAALQIPPAGTSNWIGALGDGFAYYGYGLLGLAVWLIPCQCLWAGLSRIAGRQTKITPLRLLLLLLAICSTAGLIQICAAHAPGLAALTARVNATNAGGAIGYLLTTRLLCPLISDVGAATLLTIVLATALLSLIGLSRLAAFFSGIGRWAIARDAEYSPPFDPADDAAGGPERDPYAAMKAAREAAKAEREAEKQRIRDEKEAIKAARAAAKAAAKAEREAARSGRTASAPTPAPDPVSRPVPPPQPAEAEEGETKEANRCPYVLPSLSLLNPLRPSTADHSDVSEIERRLIDTLKIFGIDATMNYTVQGPVVTKYAIELAPGTRYTAVTSISDNLMGALRAKSLRIEAPIPGESAVGIEVPNRAPAGISFREIFESAAWRNSKAELPLLFGKDAAGHELVADLASMPHMLVAGATGQGKSVCLNSLICGLLMTRTPEQLKLIMVDPKCVEFTPYAAIPHLLVPVITDNRKVVFSLHWAVAEMEKRLKLFSRAHVRNIYDFNHRKRMTQTDMFGEDSPINGDMPKTVPYIVIIIDEAADLIGQCGKDVNPDIQRITQKARAAGIHLILATQRPDAKIITGAIKANIPGRVAFKTSSSVDSRTILDDTGAENLIGRGDMLFRGKDGLLIRAQGAWISDEEIARVTEFIATHSNVEFDSKFAENLNRVKEAGIEDPFAALDKEEGDDESARAAAAEAREQVKAEENASDFKKAVECIINTNRASTSHFQRKLGWGYNHSAKIMDMLEDAGIIAPQSGAGPRQIIMDQQQLLAVFNGGGTNAGSSDAAADDVGEDAGNLTTGSEEEPMEEPL